MRYYCFRSQPSFRDPELIVNDVKQLSRFTNGPIFVIGDLFQSGADYAYAVIAGLKKLKLSNELVLEIFEPANEDFYAKLAEAVPRFNLEFSPESHDEEIRQKCGKFFSNEQIEANIRWALDSKCKKFDIFFMIGLPKQTADSVLETVEYCDYLLGKFGKRLIPFISPLSPFLDPGSLGYELPEQYGYKILFKNLEDYRQALLKPSWKYFFNYETKWLNRDQLVDVTYQSGKRLSEIKFNHGLIDKRTYETIRSKIELAQHLMRQIDEICPSLDSRNCLEQLKEMELKMERDSMSTICEKEEIKWPIWKKQLKIFNIIKAILFE